MVNVTTIISRIVRVSEVVMKISEVVMTNSRIKTRAWVECLWIQTICNFSSTNKISSQWTSQRFRSYLWQSSHNLAKTLDREVTLSLVSLNYYNNLVTKTHLKCHRTKISREDMVIEILINSRRVIWIKWINKVNFTLECHSHLPQWILWDNYLVEWAFQSIWATWMLEACSLCSSSQVVVKIKNKLLVRFLCLHLFP